jgi:hypothetical protein
MKIHTTTTSLLDIAAEMVLNSERLIGEDAAATT